MGGQRVSVDRTPRSPSVLAFVFSVSSMASAICADLVWSFLLFFFTHPSSASGVWRHFQRASETETPTGVSRSIPVLSLSLPVPLGGSFVLCCISFWMHSLVFCRCATLLFFFCSGVGMFRSTLPQGPSFADGGASHRVSVSS